jgi:hypothetical protein
MIRTTLVIVANETDLTEDERYCSLESGGRRTEKENTAPSATTVRRRVWAYLGPTVRVVVLLEGSLLAHRPCAPRMLCSLPTAKKSDRLTLRPQCQTSMSSRTQRGNEQCNRSQGLGVELRSGAQTLNQFLHSNAESPSMSTMSSQPYVEIHLPH